MLDLKDALPESYKIKADEAGVLVVRNGISAIVSADRLEFEQR